VLLYYVISFILFDSLSTMWMYFVTDLQMVSAPTLNYLLIYT